LNEFLERKIKVASSIGSDRYSVGFIGGGAEIFFVVVLVGADRDLLS
jgi:hypothetical protein